MITVAAAVALGALSACAPTFDWRELRPDGVGVATLFPCKPTKVARRVELAGRPLELTLYRCDAGGATWALAHADVQDPAQVGAVLLALRASTADNLGGAVAEPLAAQVPGQTPQAAAGQWWLQGRRPDGVPLQARMALFAKGTRVFQVTALGARLDRPAVQTFFEALRAEA